MSSKKLSAVSLFTGAGGMDVGLIQAGFNIRASVEIDPHCCDTLREAVIKEKRTTKIIEEDIRKIEPKDLLKNLQLKAGELDLLCGGPPCQSFSQIGKQKALDDERGLLLFEIVRFAKVLKPKAIFIEQVKGLLSAKDNDGKQGGVFQKLLSSLEELDYVPKWQIINSADYGVAQLRKRVFIIATKKPNGFLFPTPTHSPMEDKLSLFGSQPHVTVGEVLAGLKKPSLKNGVLREDSHVDVTPEGDRKRIRGVPEGSFLAAQKHLPKKQRGNLSKKDTTKYLRLNRKKPSNTLRCGEIFFHPMQDRYLTPKEYLRIHGYPDAYVLKGPIRSRSGRVRFLDQHRQVANSVPPPVSKAIGEQIKKVIIAKNL
jgi:DNA (cytosine-5)-methyltransferase 1